MNEGVVKAVGPGAVHPMTGQVVSVKLQVGDKVLLPGFGGSSVKVDGEELLLFREHDILAKLE